MKNEFYFDGKNSGTSESINRQGVISGMDKTRADSEENYRKTSVFMTSYRTVSHDSQLNISQRHMLDETKDDKGVRKRSV